MTTAPVAAEQLEPRIRDAAVSQSPCTHTAPRASLERDARLVAHEEVGAATLSDRQAVGHASAALDDEDLLAPERDRREAPSERAAARRRHEEDAHGIGHFCRRARAAAAAARGGGKKAHARDECDPQPVHPIRRMPPNAD